MSSDNITIEKLSEIESTLQSPDMYFGDIKVSNIQGYGYDDENNEVYKTKNLISSVLLKMVDELLMNCTDNYIRSEKSSTKMTYIKVNINGNKITIENNGLSIPVNKYKNTETYIPEIVFTSLFSSSNFNNERTGAGKNGVGASITNIMSNEFNIDITNNNVNYKQNITNNCKNINKPTIHPKQEENHVKISFIPDMKRIIDIGLDPNDKQKGIENIVFNNTLPFIKRRVLDIAMLMNKYVDVYLNNNCLSDITLQKYAKMFIGETKFIEFKKTNIFDILIPTNTNEKNKNIITFVNNIYVSKGIHISNIIDQISSYVGKRLKLKDDKFDSCKKVISRNLSIIKKFNVFNPMFEGHCKYKL